MRYDITKHETKLNATDPNYTSFGFRERNKNLEIFLLFYLYLKCMLNIKRLILPLIVLDSSEEEPS